MFTYQTIKEIREVITLWEKGAYDYSTAIIAIMSILTLDYKEETGAKRLTKKQKDYFYKVAESIINIKCF